MKVVGHRRRNNSTALVGLVLGCLIGSVMQAQAQDLPDTRSETIHDRQACTPDVMHLCRAFIPNRTAITNCLVENIDHLSPACRIVIASRR